MDKTGTMKRKNIRKYASKQILPTSMAFSLFQNSLLNLLITSARSGLLLVLKLPIGIARFTITRLSLSAKVITNC